MGNGPIAYGDIAASIMRDVNWETVVKSPAALNVLEAVGRIVVRIARAIIDETKKTKPVK